MNLIETNRQIALNWIAAFNEHSLDRWLMRLLTPTAAVDESLPDEFRALIGALTGKWVRIPGEARKGLTLPMKYETLRGEIAFFHANRPATVA